MGLFPQQPQHATRREHGQRDEPERGFHVAGAVGDDAESEAADAVAEVAPEAVNADGRAAPVGV